MDGVSFSAFGGIAVVHVTDPRALAAARRAVEGVLGAIDLACSRFRRDSELERINCAAGAEVAVSPLLAEALSAALRAAALTDGAVDPTVGRALIALGYDRDLAEVSSERARAVTVQSVPGWRAVEFDPQRRAVRVPAGVSLDLGATAKALAADRAAAAAAAAGRCGALVGLSGDFSSAGPTPDGGWPIRVTDDHRAGLSAPGQWISLPGGGLATSSTTSRRWGAPGGERHHLLDPATGLPVRPVWRTVSITAATCLDANIASTAAIVRPDGAVGRLIELGLPGRLVAEDGSVRHVAGWPQDGEELVLQTMDALAR